MITCQQFTQQVDAYLEGEPFEHGSRMGMWMHQLFCRGCKNYMLQIHDVAQLGEKLDQQDKQDEDLTCPEDIKKNLVKNYKKTNPGL